MRAQRRFDLWSSGTIVANGLPRAATLSRVVDVDETATSAGTRNTRAAAPRAAENENATRPRQVSDHPPTTPSESEHDPSRNRNAAKPGLASQRGGTRPWLPTEQADQQSQGPLVFYVKAGLPRASLAGACMKISRSG